MTVLKNFAVDLIFRYLSINIHIYEQNKFWIFRLIFCPIRILVALKHDVLVSFLKDIKIEMQIDLTLSWYNMPITESKT